MSSIPTSPTHTAWDTLAVSQFDNGNMDILVLDRPPIDGIKALVEKGRIREYLAPISQDRIGFEVRGGLGELRLKSGAFADNVIELITSFFEQFGPKKVQLRMEITRTQSCPKFHTDNVHVRLVTTYLGPTTEYQMAGESTVRSTSLNGLVFLKGHRHPTHCDSVHHRSPPVPSGQKRLCVAIDF